ncbi:MAG: DUF3566 domain-containing protein [Actinomycetes bacterium]
MSSSQLSDGMPNARRARLRLKRIDPWSLAKLAFIVSLGIAIAIAVAVALLWLLFSQAGVFDSVGRTTTDVFGSSVDPQTLFGFGPVMALTAVVAIVQVLLTTAISALLASLYNLAAYFVGGLQIVLVED